MNVGESWGAVNTGLTDTQVEAMAIGLTTPTTVYVGTYSAGVFRSTDGGEHWSAANTGLPPTVVTALAVDPAMPSILYAGTMGSGAFVMK